MIKKNKLGRGGVVFFAALAVIMTVGSAEAKDFKFTVPITMSSIHEDAAKIAVKCFVRVSGQTREIIGSKTVLINRPANGRYTGNVVVEFDADNGKNPADAGYYKCAIGLKKAGGGVQWVRRSGNNAADAWKTSKAGSRFVQQTSRSNL